MNAGKQRPRVLVVDDNAANVELLEAYLATSGWEVSSASGGREAIDKTAAFAPDVILLDVMMPEIDGHEVCRKIRSDPGTRDTVIILVTALSSEADVERGIEAGADDFLSKPVNRLELLTRVRSLLRLRSLKGELARAVAYSAEVARRPSSGDRDPQMGGRDRHDPDH